MSLYELFVLGDYSSTELRLLSRTIKHMVADFGMTMGTDVVFRDSASFSARNKRAASAAVYFGGTHQLDLPIIHEIVSASIPIIPTIGPTGDFATLVPTEIQSSNGLRRRSADLHYTELAVALLECVGLLRQQRRIFVSYRRIESRAAAMQLHDLMTSRGFDVFLDTHDIRPGEIFQDVLWHRLCDSDVVVMLDTPTYFESKWTRQEIGRARAKDIHVLRVVWPDHTPNKLTDMAETIYLEKIELEGTDGPIVAKTADDIVIAVENLRSRSIAARYMAISGKLRADIQKIGAEVEGIGAYRAMSLRLIDDRRLWAYPVVGIPTAELFNDIAQKALRAEQNGMPILVYDHIGIRDSWIAHLKWLDDNIHAVRAIKVSEAGWALAGM